MKLATFIELRDLPGKTITGDIRFSARNATRPVLISEALHIENSRGIDARLNITHNPSVGSTTFNVSITGVGPVCRLDVDGVAHRPAGRTHKHSLKSEECPDRNLPDGVNDMPGLSGCPIEMLFEAFCAMAKIEHNGDFYPPRDIRDQ
jgi:hypothetical protein